MMTLRSRVGVAAAVVASLLALPLLAQEARKKGAGGAPPKAATTAGSPAQGTTTTTTAEPRKGPDQVRRVPPYFAKLDSLTESQRESIYKARARRLPEIERLQKQLDDAHAQLMAESEAVLTPAQRQQLAQLRASAKGRGAHEEAYEATAKTTPEPAKGGAAAKAAPEPATTKGRRPR